MRTARGRATRALGARSVGTDGSRGARGLLPRARYTLWDRASLRRVSLDTVGLFRDIDEAIASPGKAVDRQSGDYIIHRDYTTSGRINQALGTGITTFRVRARGRLYELTIERP